MNYTKEDVLAVKMLVKSREDFAFMRIKTDNRIGRKADGEMQNIDERGFRLEDIELFSSIADNCKQQEKIIEKNLKKIMERFPIYTEYLKNIKGIGTISAGWIISSFDIYKATTVSKMWQYAGLNAELVKGKKRVEDEEGNITFEETGELIRGDKLTIGYVSPYNTQLRKVLIGIMGDGFIKQQNNYALNFYYPYKHRLENSNKEVLHLGKMVPWKNVSPAHRHRASVRYMVKMFIKDLYIAWRELEGLPVRAPYQEEYLGHVHSA